jgi:hypothetical protein
MKIHHEELADIRRYLDNEKDVALEERGPIFATSFVRFNASSRSTLIPG